MIQPIEQLLLLPQNLHEWVPEYHIARFVLNFVNSLDISPFMAGYKTSGRGRSAYHPSLTLKLVILRALQNIRSSRAIALAAYTDLGFRMFSGDQHPHFDSIAALKQKYRKDLADLFPTILERCISANMVDCQHISIDGTKIEANASKHKAMNYA